MSRRSKALRYYRSAKPRSPLQLVLRRIIKLILLLFILYQIVSLLFIRSYTMRADYMRPTLERGETLITSPLLYGPSLPFGSYEIPPLRSPNRGDIVVVRSGHDSSPWYIDLLDAGFRFFTLQQLSIKERRSDIAAPAYSIRRVVAIPGDSVKMEAFRIKIKTKGKSVFLDEREIVQREYDLTIPENEKEMNNGLPFSGYMEEMKLEEGEYLIVSDNRIAEALSENWRPRPVKSVESLLLLHFRLPF